MINLCNPLRWRGFWLLVVGVTLWRVAALYWAALPPMADEAQYRFYAANLALSYYSKPPLLPWLIALSEHIFGSGMASARLLMPLLHALNAYLIARAVRVVAPTAQAVTAGSLYILMPAISYSSGLSTTDPVMMTGWCLALWGATRLWHQQRATSYSMALMGVGLGFSALGKYVGLVWWLGTWPLWRKHSKVLLRVAVLSLIVMLPHIIGLALNKFNTLQHTADNVNVQASIGHISELLEFWAGQLAIFGVIPIFVLLRAFWQRRTPQIRWFMGFAWPLLLLMSAQAFMSRAHANWAAAAYIGACAVVALAVPATAKWWRVNQGVHGAVAIALPLLIALLNSVAPHISARFDPAAEARSFMRVQPFIAQTMQQTGSVGVMSHHRRTLSLLIEHAQLTPAQIAVPPLASTQQAKTHYETYYTLPSTNTQRWLYITFSLKGCAAAVPQPVAGHTLRAVAQFLPHAHAFDGACFVAYVVE